jgi:hypothetical protein
LENFDVIGRWRDNYRVIIPEKANAKTIGQAGREVPIQYTEGLPVDASDVLPDGRTFKDIREFKQLLLSDPDQIARTVTSKLLIYSTGAHISFADRAIINRMVSSTKEQDSGFRSLIHAVVQSPLFRSK